MFPCVFRVCDAVLVVWLLVPLCGSAAASTHANGCENQRETDAWSTKDMLLCCA